MSRVVEITSLSTDGLEPYRNMRRTLEHRQMGIFVAEGEKVVRRLVESNLEIISILLTPEWYNIHESILRGRVIADNIYVARKEILESIVGYGLHQGIMSIGKVPKAPDTDTLVETMVHPRLIVAVDGVANSENMGVIVRNCAAFGVQLLIAGETSCDPYLRRSVRNSMGTIFKLPVVKAGSLRDCLHHLRESHDVKVIAAHPQRDSVDLSELDLTADSCIVFGSEGEGISSEVLKSCDAQARVRMENEVDSLNVATSVGVVLYEIGRQRLQAARQPGSK